MQGEPTFTTYIPTTVLGLLGLVFLYLYFYFKNKDDNKLKEIQDLDAGDKIKAIEMALNDIGVRIDTTGLDSVQKVNIIEKLLRKKTQKQLIIAITSISLAVIIAFVLNNSSIDPPVVKGEVKDTVPVVTTINFESEFAEINSRVTENIKKDNLVFSNIDPTYTVELITEPEGKAKAVNGTADGFDYYYDSTEVKISVNKLKPFGIGVMVPKTAFKSSPEDARSEYKKNCLSSVNTHFNKLWDAIKKAIHK